MTITYPRALPSLRIADCYFEPELQEAHAPEQGGRFVSTELGPPLFVAHYATTPPSEEEFDKWRAWLASLRGAGRLFYGQDVRRRFPRYYKSGFTDLVRAGSEVPFDGTTSAWSVNSARDEITLGDDANQELPIAFRLTLGDYIGLRWSTSKRSLHRVLEDVNTDANGVGAWTVEPPIPVDVPGSANVNLAAPDCLMVITNRGDLDATDGKSRRVSFEAKQHLEF